MRVDQYENSDIEKQSYEQATDERQYLIRRCWDMWDPRDVIPLEVGNWHDKELEEDKAIHTVLDCSSAMDYVVDPFTQPPFGLNHRVHSPGGGKRRFDLRAENDSNAKPELETLCDSLGTANIVPKYATRMKLDKDGVEWFRIVYLKPLIEAIEKGGFRAPKTHDGEDHTAWLYEYDTLKNMGAFVAEFDGHENEVFGLNEHKSLEGHKPTSGETDA